MAKRKFKEKRGEGRGGGRSEIKYDLGLVNDFFMCFCRGGGCQLLPFDQAQRDAVHLRFTRHNSQITSGT